MMRVALPEGLRMQILTEASAAFPRECCGLLEGVCEGADFRVTALHPARNLADAADRFEIEPRDHLAAQKQARANGLALIGCYHSHPDGAAEPSATDRAGAGEEDFVWLIAGLASGTAVLNAFVFARGGFAAAELAGGGQAPL
jgi:proteasome lid subunit RPN8/RPN11